MYRFTKSKLYQICIFFTNPTTKKYFMLPEIFSFHLSHIKTFLHFFKNVRILQTLLLENEKLFIQSQLYNITLVTIQRNLQKSAINHRK